MFQEPPRDLYHGGRVYQVNVTSETVNRVSFDNKINKKGREGELPGVTDRWILALKRAHARTFGEESKFIFDSRARYITGAYLRKGIWRIARMNYAAGRLINIHAIPEAAWKNSLFMRRQLNYANASSCYFRRYYHAPLVIWRVSGNIYGNLCNPGEISGDKPDNQAAM